MNLASVVTFCCH